MHRRRTQVIRLMQLSYPRFVQRWRNYRMSHRCMVGRCNWTEASRSIDLRGVCALRRFTSGRSSCRDVVGWKIPQRPGVRSILSYLF
jgi:hypothetical protein